MDTFGAMIVIEVPIILVLIRQRNLDRRRLQQFVASSLSGGETGRAAVFRLASRIFDLPDVPDDPIWASRLFKAFGASPGAVIEAGACCSGKTRLLILSLAEIGMRAYQITFYHREGYAQHCLAEVCVDDARLLLDPTYGVYLTDGDGHGVSLQDLRRGVQPVHMPFTTRADWGYPRDSYYHFDYAATKTANWTRSVLRRVAYSILHGASRGAVDNMMIPAWLEWPQNLGLLACMTLLSLVALATACAAY